ncbi:MAG: phosphoglucosamine mutase [Neomegalonema sp.]|nr:phosphoglucosamine mutase [Neomegalonema sp.]
MSRKLFGTDGVRGKANSWPMTADMALSLGMAAGRYFRTGDAPHRVVIGKDTRLSGYMIEAAMMSGLVSMGMDVYLLGPVPTPAVGMLTRSLRADLGVMISASHNPFHDNGIKFFGPDGYKLSDEAEQTIEAYMANGLSDHVAAPRGLGKISRLEDGRARYIEFAKATFPKDRRLDGVKVVVDCANGAAYRTAPEILWELGAEVIRIGCEPNGTNINENCGSTSPKRCQVAVIEHGADLGLALDGDADRIHIIDEKGQIVDGDQIMGLIAREWAREDRLKGGGLVSTVMSNLGLEKYLEMTGLKLIRTKVGDRYVVEEMRKGGYNVGGEQSGHIVLNDFVTTGDGAIAALQVLAAIRRADRPASEVCRLFDPFPQLLRNVRYERGSTPLEADAVKAAITAGEAKLGKSGRLVIRASGTEPVIRVMGEAENADLMEQVVGDICEAVTAAL